MKNWIYSILNKKLIFSILFACSTFLAPSQLFAGQMPNAAAPAMPEMTPQQMAELEQELAKINEEMQAFVKTLPPEKQEEIAQLEEAINNMSDEELEQLFEQLFTDPNFLQELEQMYPEQPAPQEPVAAEPEQVQTPGEKPLEKPKVEKNKIAQAAEMIKSLSETTDAFLSKIENIHEIDDIVRNWIKKSQLHGWKTNVDWHIIKSQLDLFNQKLKKMLTKEPGSNEYRFLPDLIKEEAVYNNLAHMESILKVTVPKITVSVLGFVKSSQQESKDTVLVVLNKYAEGMSSLQLIPALNAIIDKHEPIAKQLREKEDALSKKALEESKKPRAEKPMVTAGKAEAYRGGSDYKYQDSSYYPNYNSSYQPSYSPSYGAQPEAARGGEKPAGGGAGAGKSGGKGDKGGDKDKDKDKGKDKGKGQDKDGKKDDKKSSQGKENPLAKAMADIEKKLKEANKACESSDIFNINKRITSPLFDTAEKVKDAANKINAAAKAVKKLGEVLEDKPENTKKDYQGKVKRALKSQVNLVTLGENITRIDQITVNALPAEQKAIYGFEIRTKKQDDKDRENVETNMDAQQSEPVEVATPAPILDEAARAAQQAGRPADEQQLFNAEPRQGAPAQTTTKTTAQAGKKGTQAQAAEGQPAPEEAAEAPRYISSLEVALTGLHQAIADLTK
jgi:hypothetical protein